jgi:hypothetical protein
MIRYALHCAKGHDFESWFPNSAAYDKQVKRDLVSCPSCGSTKVEKAIMAPQESEFRAKLKELRDHLTKNADYVGQKFPEEARKMHYGEIDHRSIYGEASPDEAKDLHEEGIEFHPLPVLPDERN